MVFVTYVKKGCVGHGVLNQQSQAVYFLPGSVHAVSRRRTHVAVVRRLAPGQVCLFFNGRYLNQAPNQPSAPPPLSRSLVAPGRHYANQAKTVISHEE